VLVATALLGLLAACSGGHDSDAGPRRSPGPTATPTSTPTATEISQPTVSTDLVVDGSLRLPGRPYRIRTTCWGAGAPTIVLENGYGDGASTLHQMFADETLLAFAQLGTVCVYDRAGSAASGAVPPGRRRTIHDLSTDLHLLLARARVPRPFVIVGNSFGGDVAMDFASTYPDGVGAVVLLDVPPPNPHLSWKELGGGSWRDNADLLDVVSVEHSLARHPPELGDIPLRAVLATDSDTTKASQAFWLRMTSRGVLAQIAGDHGLFYSNPSGVIRQVTAAIRSMS
jgi:pimeloyl-ACP methyl ester carboxylesterase